MRAIAEAHPNFALIKYWGKRDEVLNLPYTGSLSVTIGPVCTRTEVSLEPGLAEDLLVLDGEVSGGRPLARVQRFLSLLREVTGERCRARVTSQNGVPTGAGLASSASGFAALTLAYAAAVGWSASLETLSAVARRGSGSACRSLHGGFVEWLPGERADGADSHGIPVETEGGWRWRVLLVVVDSRTKPVSSSEAMARSVGTSSFYPGWVSRVARDLPLARRAVQEGALASLGPVMEGNAMAMFGVMLGSEPPVRYWRPATLAVLEGVEALRRGGVGAYYTLDAGPNVKVLCEAEAAERVARSLEAVPGVERVLTCEVGGPARRVA